MNIILTSAGLKMPAIQTQILDLLPKPTSQLKLAHIITASRFEANTTFVDNDRAAMAQCGFRVTDILLENLTPATCLSVLNAFDIIYVQGGNGFYLLKQARACGFGQAVRHILQDPTKWYIGVSAGSYLACPTLEMHTWKREKNRYGLTDLTALNLVPFLVVVHYNREKYREVLAKHIPIATHPVRILTDNQAFWVKNEAVTLLGTGPEILSSTIAYAKLATG